MSIALRTILFTVLVPFSVGGWVPWLLAGRPPVAGWPGPERWIGIPLCWLGLGIYLWTVWDFGSKGQGTPAPWDPPRALVVDGLYRWVRNPMYLGAVTAILGEAILWRSTAVAVYVPLLWAGFHLRVVHGEEPALRREFGASFDEYCARVPRWIPRRPRPA